MLAAPQLGALSPHFTSHAGVQCLSHGYTRVLDVTENINNFDIKIKYTKSFAVNDNLYSIRSYFILRTNCKLPLELIAKKACTECLRRIFHHILTSYHISFDYVVNPLLVAIDRVVYK